jgi:hypothetical protein
MREAMGDWGYELLGEEITQESGGEEKMPKNKDPEIRNQKCDGLPVSPIIISYTHLRV